MNKTLRKSFSFAAALAMVFTLSACNSAKTPADSAASSTPEPSVSDTPAPQDSPSPSQSEQTPEQSPTPTPTPSTPADNASTYSNGRYGYVLNLATGWQMVKENADGDGGQLVGPQGASGKIWGSNSPKVKSSYELCNTTVERLEKEGYSKVRANNQDERCTLAMVKGQDTLHYVGFVGTGALNEAEIIIKDGVGEAVATNMLDSFTPGDLSETK